MTGKLAVIGLDVGGSRSRAVLDVGGATVAESRGLGASVTSAGEEEAGAVLVTLLEDLGLARGSGPLGSPGAGGLDAACIGTAGSGTAAEVAWLRNRLREVVKDGSADRVLVVNDSRLVLAAEGLESGIAVIAGTGSTAIGVVGGREHRAGGWGYLLGDEGSGYWVAREAVREICRRHDEEAIPGPLVSVFGRRSAKELIARFHESPEPWRWASYAPTVLDCADPFAEVVMAGAARALTALAADVARRLDHPAPVPVVLAGGLLVGNDRLRAKTRRAVEERIPECSVLAASMAPVHGAVRLARQLAAQLAVASA